MECKKGQIVVAILCESEADIVRGFEIKELAPIAPLVLPIVMPHVTKSLSLTLINLKKGSLRIAAMIPVRTTRMIVLESNESRLTCGGSARQYMSDDSSGLTLIRRHRPCLPSQWPRECS